MKTFGCRLGVCTALAMCTSFAAGRAPLPPGAVPPKPWLVINEDNDRYFKRADLPGNIEKTTAEACEQYLDTVLDGGKVTHFFMCVCGQRASYDSKAWEPIWKGLEGVERDGSPATNNAWCVNAKKMSDAGVDPYAIWTRRCRKKGVSPWISMRMNDIHFCSVSNYFRTESFWTEHPELHLKRPEQKPSWNEHAFNYKYAKVRRHAYAMVDEILDRWDADGIELDWLRFEKHLTLGKEESLSYVLTDFMRGVRKRADTAAKRRGHPVRIAVRIPPVYALARHLGYDPETWAKEGLVDIITVCNAYSASNFDFDVADWQARIRRANPSVTVLPGTDIPFACMPANDSFKLMANGENMPVRRGWCAVHANPEGFYFFNVPYLDAAARNEIYSRSLQPERLERLSRRFIVSYHDIAAKGKCRPRQLPVTLDRSRTLVTRAARGKNDAFAYVVAGFAGANPRLPPSVMLNGVAAVGEPERLSNARPYGGGLAKSAVRWMFPGCALKPGENEIGFSANPDGKAQIVWCEIALPEPGKTPRDFERMHYNNPGATSFLGVGLWAWPMAFDYDGDGDLDLVVSCPDTPYNGTYFFENTTPKGEKNAKPVFKRGMRQGKGYGNTVVTSYRGKPVVTRPGYAVWNPQADICGEAVPVKGLPTNVHPNKVRGNTWRFVDWDGDGQEDILVGVGDWTDYGWANAYDAHGSWTNGPLRGLLYVCRHVKGEGPDAEYAPAEQVRVVNLGLTNGAPLEVYGNPMPMAADWDGDGDLDLICGSFMDDFTFFENVGTRAAPRFAAGRKLTAADGKKLAMDLQMITPSAVDWDGDGRLDIICGDEDGRVAFIRNTGRLEKGMPVFEKPYYFRQEADCVKFGALSTPFACDWDGDGDWDVIAGNSAGYLAFIENLSGAGVAKPRWAEPKLLSAGGEVGLHGADGGGLGRRRESRHRVQLHLRRRDLVPKPGREGRARPRAGASGGGRMGGRAARARVGLAQAAGQGASHAVAHVGGGDRLGQGRPHGPRDARPGRIPLPLQACARGGRTSRPPVAAPRVRGRQGQPLPLLGQDGGRERAAQALFRGLGLRRQARHRDQRPQCVPLQAARPASGGRVALPQRVADGREAPAGAHELSHLDRLRRRRSARTPRRRGGRLLLHARESTR